MCRRGASARRRWRRSKPMRNGAESRCCRRWRRHLCRHVVDRRGWSSPLLDAAGYRAMLRESRDETTEDRLENLQELLTIAASFHTARELLDHAALSTNGPTEDEAGRVRLMTLHKAKGLEFEHVFLPGWEAGIFPPHYGEIDEERRLAYVALT